MQQINLYQDALRPAREYLALAQLCKAAGILLLLLGLINLGQEVITWRGEQQYVALDTEQVQLKKQLEQLQSEVQARAAENNAEKLKTQLAQQDTQLQNKQQVLQMLTGRSVGNVAGFATQLSGLARQRIEGLWLTSLYIHDGGEKLNLSGSTSTADLLPKYLQRLALEPSFHGIEFKSFVMQRAKDKPQVDFDLRSSPEEKAK
jgi:hypothetical protein